MQDIQDLFVFQLPTLVLTAPGAENKVYVPKNRKKGKRAASKNAVGRASDVIEAKVLANAGMLISTSQNRNECVQTLGDCLADAVGLFVDFSDLPQ